MLRICCLLRLLCLAAVCAATIACGGDDGEPSAIDAGGTFTVMNQDGADHLHELSIDCADVDSDVPVSYTATGPHEHTVTLNVEDLHAIGSGQTVTVSFTDGHDHTFEIAKPGAGR